MSELSDKELLIRFEGKLDVFDTRLSNLSESINKFTDTIKHIDENKISALNARVNDIETWKSKMAGAWVVILFLGGLITAAIIGLFKYFMK